MNKIEKEVTENFKKFSKVILNEEILESNYVNLKLFDSISFVKMISALEDQFKVFFSNKDFKNPLFQTAGGIAKIIWDKQSNIQKI